MGTFTLTAAELHNELAEMQAHRQAYQAAASEQTGFEMTAAEALAFEMSVCPEVFDRMLTFAARRAVYGAGVWEADAAVERGEGLVNHSKERRVQRLVTEMDEVITASTRPKNEYAEGFALTAAFAATFENAEAIRPIKASVSPITVGATAIYREDTTSLVREGAARTISKRYARGTAATFDASTAAIFRILAGIEALAGYLVALPGPLATAEFKDLGVSLERLYDEAADALDTLRYSHKVTRREGRAARDLAAFEAGLEGLDEEEQADAWLAREEQIVRWGASKSESERAKAKAAGRARAVLALRGGVSTDAEDAPQLDGVATFDDFDHEDREEALLAGLDGVYAAIAPAFGYADPAELAAAIKFRTDGLEKSRALSNFFGTSNSRPYHKALARARALDIDAVKAALLEEMAAI